MDLIIVSFNTEKRAAFCVPNEGKLDSEIFNEITVTVDQHILLSK